MANSQGEGNAFATPRSSTWIVLNCILFVIVLDSCCWWLDKGLSRVFKGQTGFEFWVLRFRFLGASFSRFGCSVFEFWVLCFRDLGASFSRFGYFVLRSSFSSASFSKLPETGIKNRCVIEGTHFLRRKLRERLNLELFRNMSVHEFCRLKALITWNKWTLLSGGKKDKNLN